MFLNLETDYAIRIVHTLASSDSRLDAKTIAARTGVTPRFTLKILHGLVSSGIVKSYKGASGGYILAKDANEITLLDVVEETCGPLELSQCQSEGECTHPDGFCRFRGVFSDVSEYMKQKFSNITFAENGKE